MVRMAKIVPSTRNNHKALKNDQMSRVYTTNIALQYSAGEQFSASLAANYGFPFNEKRKTFGARS